ncbi:hypothetical protein [Paenibacillus soyae]|uniref:Uncharacterized protein n=1 Tax=Paenibacillus soyae TaxID=2969249 RepID=A0A9X2MT58_9BACL|nr:hypothetical protein [Paenibacillus soyae]MCR2805398.1 hypothetical protein [Paenibacillus soyae]
MLFQVNERIRLAHEYFKFAYFFTLSKEAFRVGDMLYWFISNLTSDVTEITEDKFNLDIRKLDLARDLGYKDASSFRKRTDKRNGLTVWGELAKVGFEFCDGHRFLQGRKVIKAKKTTIQIPLVFEQIDWESVQFPSFFNTRRDKFIGDLRSIEYKINKLSNEKNEVKWHDIDYENNSIRTFKIYQFRHTSQEKIDALLLRQYCWLATRCGGTLSSSIGQQQIMSQFKAILQYTCGGNYWIQDTFMKMAYNLPTSLSELNKRIRYNYKSVTARFHMSEYGLQYDKIIKEDSMEQKREKRLQHQITDLENKLNSASKSKYEVLKEELGKYKRDENGVLIGDADGRWGSYLSGLLSKAKNEELMRDKEEKYRMTELKCNEIISHTYSGSDYEFIYF